MLKYHMYYKNPKQQFRKLMNGHIKFCISSITKYSYTIFWCAFGGKFQKVSIDIALKSFVCKITRGQLFFQVFLINFKSLNRFEYNLLGEYV